MSPPGVVAGLIGIVASALFPILTGLMLFVLGGCRAGRIKRSLEVKVREAELAGFQERLHKRLSEIGFTALTDDGNYVQVPGEHKDPTASTHAEKAKLLTVHTSTSPSGEGIVQLTVGYGDIIFCDSGETAYLTAVLDYVSGAKDAIKETPNRVFQGINALVGGIVIALACYFLTFEPVQKYWFALVIVGASNTALGIQAFQKIRGSRGELIGQWEPFAGVVLGVAGMAFALVPVVKAEILKFLERF